MRSLVTKWKQKFEQQIPQKSHLVDLWTRESKIVISMPNMKQLKNGGLKMNKETRISILLFQAWTRGLNGILLSKLFWPTVRKNCSSDREKLLKFEAEGREFAKFFRSLEQTVRTMFDNRMLFKLVPGGYSYLIN